MTKSNKFSPEVRERAVRMVQDHRGEYPSLWAAVESIASKIGCVPQTLLIWVKRHEVDGGVREGVTTGIRGQVALSHALGGIRGQRALSHVSTIARSLRSRC